MEFKEFKIEDLFEVKNTKGFNTADLVQGVECDYITRTSKNQGILTTTGFITNETPNSANTISVGLLQMDFFFRTRPWYAGQFVRLIVPKFDINTKRALYFVTLLNKLKPILLSVLVRDFDKTFKNSMISLPVTPSGEIDFDYMEQYIEKIEKQYIEKIALMLKASGLDNYQLTEEEKAILKEEKEKKEFKIDELWVVDDFVTGKDKKWNTQYKFPVKNSVPVISGQTTNNGVKYYTTDSYTDDEVFEDCLTMTTVGEYSGTCFYHPGKFLLANNIMVLKTPKYSRNVMLYFVTVLNKLDYGGYAKNVSKSSLKTKTITLPVKNGEIDFDYMEKYISAIIKTKIKNVVLEINKKLELYKQTQN
jgi:hypothetical protein